MKKSLFICLALCMLAVNLKAEHQTGRFYDECNSISDITWLGNIKIVSDGDWTLRQGDIFRFVLDDPNSWSYIVYDMPAGKFVKNILIDFYSPTGLKPTLAVKNAQGVETKYVLGWANGYPEETESGTNIKRHYLDKALIPDDSFEACVYLDANSDVEILRVVVEYEDGYVAPDYNENADFGRIQQLLAKAEAGNNLTIGVIGGSMTAGANADPMTTNCYGGRLKAWFESAYGIQVNLVNAGIGSTNSYFGAIRAEEHLLKYNPDLIVVEYACNDQPEDIYNHTYEGLLRKVLKAPGYPAVVALMLCSQAGFTQQAMHLPIAQHYQLPIISYNDAVKNDIVSGDYSWLDYYSTTTVPQGDGVHPNNAAHQKMADMFAALAATIQPDASALISAELPEPKFSNRLEDAFFLSETDIQPEKIGTWTNGGSIWNFNTGNGWRSNTAGSELIFDIIGDVATVTYWKRPANEGFGRAIVWVDDKDNVTIDGSNGEHIDQLILFGLGAGKHQLHIKLLDNKPFEVTCIAVSGDRDFYNSTHNIQSNANQNEIAVDGNNLILSQTGNAVTISRTVDGYLTFQINSKYMGVNNADGSIVLYNNITDATKFLFVDKGDGLAFRSVSNGKYLSTQNGLSASSDHVTINELFSLTPPFFTGNQRLSVEKLQVYAAKGSISVLNATGKKIKIFSIDGKMYLNTVSSHSLFSTSIAEGVYFVSIDRDVVKIIVH
jgi:lysophospholipase L1-like esterase